MNNQIKKHTILSSILIIISIIMSIGGALNSGLTSFWLATPFMIYLLKQPMYRQNMRIFVAICLFLSITNNQNPILHPILNDGYVTIMKEGTYTVYEDDSSGFSADIEFSAPTAPFILDDDDKFLVTETPNRMINDSYVKSTKQLHVDEKFKVIGISHHMSDFHDNVEVVTVIGNFRPRANDISLSKPIETFWATWIGYLMYYPVLFFMLDSLYNSI